MMTSGMHRRPFEGRHLVWFSMLILSRMMYKPFLNRFIDVPYRVNHLLLITTYRPLIHRRDAHMNFFHFPSDFKIEILAIGT